MKAKLLVVAGLTSAVLLACGGSDTSTESLNSSQKQMAMSVKATGKTADEIAAEKNFSPATL
ncbi:MAG: hypothetical protein JO002_14970, partial [Burkholderiaceae bacterium]|nr:hypothetical protein [Burkholderiaceae bacterium]